MKISGLFVKLGEEETRSTCTHDSMNRPKFEFIIYVYILHYQSIINFHLTCLFFRILLIESDITEVTE